jgi:hypothetical protein
MPEGLTIPEAMVRGVIDPSAYADGVTALEAMAWLRANNPLGRAEGEGLFPFWIVSKHADILEISRQNDLFHSGDRSATFNTVEGDERVAS